LLEHRHGGIVAWNTWHVSDAYGWHTEWYPSLFDNNYNPKPAYFAVSEELSKNRD
jgi:endo-1,4-beta-xylanase